MSSPILAQPDQKRQADDLRRRLQGTGYYFRVDLSADDADPAALRAELAEIAEALHTADLAALWLIARAFEGTMPDAALFTIPRERLASD